MITMKDIIREGNPTLRAVAEEVPVPITEEDRHLAAPQLDISKRIIAVHVPSNDPENETPSLSTVMYNPKILSHSVQDVCLGEGEGCLSVDRDVPGYVVRHNKITVSYFDMAGEKHKVRLKNYEAIVVQHEIDHINGIMFYDHINKENPFALKEGVLVIE